MQKGWHPGCVSERACTHCYHVISDSICLCVNHFICPKCGGENGTKIQYIPAINSPTGSLSTYWPGLISMPEVYITGAGI